MEVIKVSFKLRKNTSWGNRKSIIYHSIYKKLLCISKDWWDKWIFKAIHITNRYIKWFQSKSWSGEITSCEIYKVESDEKKDNVLHYYVSADYKTKMKEKEASTEKIYCKIDVAKINDSYLVIRPISNVSHERKLLRIRKYWIHLNLKHIQQLKHLMKIRKRNWEYNNIIFENI